MEDIFLTRDIPNNIYKHTLHPDISTVLVFGEMRVLLSTFREPPLLMEKPLTKVELISVVVIGTVAVEITKISPPLSAVPVGNMTKHDNTLNNMKTTKHHSTVI